MFKHIFVSHMLVNHVCESCFFLCLCSVAGCLIHHPATTTKLTFPGNRVSKLPAGSVLGELALMNDQPRHEQIMFGVAFLMGFKYTPEVEQQKPLKKLPSPKRDLSKKNIIFPGALLNFQGVWVVLFCFYYISAWFLWRKQTSFSTWSATFGMQFEYGYIIYIFVYIWCESFGMCVWIPLLI